MPSENISFWGRRKHIIRSRMISGMVVLVPIALTLLILKWLLNLMAGILEPVANKLLGLLGPQTKQAVEKAVPLEISVPVVSIILLVLLVYLVGGITAHVFGKKVFATAEGIVMRIPLVKTIYATTKQVMQAVSLPDRAAFKAVVTAEFPKPGMVTIGFLTGTIQSPDGQMLYKVFFPTAPNPTTGFFEMIRPELVQFTNLSVEEGFKMIISAGILSPDRYELRPPVR